MFGARVTRMLIRVADAREAAQADAAGVDVVEFRFTHADHPDTTTAQAIRAAFRGRLRLRINGPSITPEIMRAAVDAQADELAMPAMDALSPIFDRTAPAAARLDVIAEVAVTPDAPDTLIGLGSKAKAVMFESAPGARILDLADVAQLDALAASCRAHGLDFGFAGGLEAPDVARLLLLAPDVLAFDSAVRIGHAPDGALDTEALDAIRTLLPRDKPTVQGRPRVVTDRLFVRNFVVPLSIGAYQAEHGVRQRVRFSVEAEVSREQAPPRDMRDVFSYDVIIETIRVLAGRKHVTFVETLAEEVAAAVLAHPTVVSTTILVEKLDVIDGEVGIEIHRGRDA